MLVLAPVCNVAVHDSDDRDSVRSNFVGERVLTGPDL
jgi:hypothetical protein